MNRGGQRLSSGESTGYAGRDGFNGVTYQVERVRLGPHLSRNAVRQVLSAHAEYGGWELQRLRRYRDGTRDVWIRRKIIRVTAEPLTLPGQRAVFGPPDTSSRANAISGGSSVSSTASAGAS